MSDQTQPKGAAHLSDADFVATLKQAGDQPVFVDFYAEWCGPCKLAAPIIDKLADEYRGKAVLAKVDVDAHNDLAKQFGVMSIPTVIVFKRQGEESKEVNRLIGFQGEPKYREMLDKALSAG